MSTASETLIADVHPALSLSALPEAVITLTPSAPIWLHVTDATLTIGREVAAPLVYQLGDLSLAGLVAALPAWLGAQLLSTTWADVRAYALTPVEGVAIGAGYEYRLNAYTAGLWRVMRPLAFGLAELGAAAELLTRQIDLRQAAGVWLDLWGLVWSLPRLPEEDDLAYRNRIIYTITLPRANNTALEELIFRAFGRLATVRDGDLGGVLTLNVAGQTWGPPDDGAVLAPQQYGFFVVEMDEAEGGYTVDQLVALIRQYKAAGAFFTVNTRYAPTAEIFFADVLVDWS